MNSNENKHLYLDEDWIKLMGEAKQIGLSPEEVLVFLSDQRSDDEN
ncbi:anti-repressor SinI family protein [Salibacterium aidingense]|nr:anti-repressor SinI family protein [Salibacterium aidingense]